MQGDDLGAQRCGHLRCPDPVQENGWLGLGTPAGGVLGEDARRDFAGHRKCQWRHWGLCHLACSIQGILDMVEKFLPAGHELVEAFGF